ncbi:RNA methyl transferase TrmH [Candidatus Nitrosoglobus terrae]|uniref:tRNA (cytidine/uridine-2'-O-)-methyltransferase TrmJ n=1 Tax=Candidatus Nitrosoglobus terrae TaxID=1630141 RepID=A0A1Q2SMN3_9GAMM|nr:RNA methyltransferase [Candidatus Nitrosoglobus terrae]BAW80373.1 RNA methyl transferase TrmH [Candidatus Nitrosoglobus terrae]
MSLARVRIVLVETTHPGNIGAAARAMHTMGLSRLYLVNPKDFPSAIATARASGADHLLAQAKIFPSLLHAISDCQIVFGLSARQRNISSPAIDARACGILVVKEAAKQEVAIVFGCEHSGISNAELDYCNYLVHIPSNPIYRSLNLGAAVQVVVYEIQMAYRIGAISSSKQPLGSDLLASASEVEGFFKHLEEALIDIDFLNPNKPRFLIRRLRRLFLRTHLDIKEINILRGILTAVQKIIHLGQNTNTH